MTVLSKIEKIFIGIFTVMFFLTFMLILFIDKGIQYSNQSRVTIPNIILFIIGILLFAIWLLFYRKIVYSHISGLSSKQCRRILMAVNLLFLAVQIFVFYNIYFQTGWDTGTLAEVSHELAKGNYDINPTFFGDYLSRYPNNVLLTFLLVLIKKISLQAGITDTYFVTVLLGIIGVNIVCYLITLIVKEITKSRHYAAISYVFSVFFIGLSPWCVIPYSDIYAMFFTTVLLYLYVRRKYSKRPLARAFAIILIAFIGTMIKPTVVIVLIAMAINEFLHMTSGRDAGKKMGRWLIGAVLSAIIVSASVRFATSYIGLIPNENAEFSLTHYAMMGLNDETTGGFYGPDVDYSISFPNTAERTAANLEVIQERLTKKGLWGLIKFEVKKMMMNYNDGSYSWTNEGEFFKDTSLAPDTLISEKLRDIYYANDNAFIFNSSQVIWLVLLSLNVIAGFGCLKYGNREENTIFLTLVGISVFILLFEGRSRYLLLYRPYYVIAAMAGLRYLNRFLQKKAAA